MTGPAAPQTAPAGATKGAPAWGFALREVEPRGFIVQLVKHFRREEFEVWGEFRPRDCPDTIKGLIVEGEFEGARALAEGWLLALARRSGADIAVTHRFKFPDDSDFAPGGA